jgi:hypothetical protein
VGGKEEANESGLDFRKTRPDGHRSSAQRVTQTETIQPKRYRRPDGTFCAAKFRVWRRRGLGKLRPENSPTVEHAVADVNQLAYLSREFPPAPSARFRTILIAIPLTRPTISA